MRRQHIIGVLALVLTTACCDDVVTTPTTMPSVVVQHDLAYWAALGLSPVCIDPRTGQARTENGGLKPGWSRTATGYEPNTDPLPIPWPCAR